MDPLLKLLLVSLHFLAGVFLAGIAFYPERGRDHVVSKIRRLYCNNPNVTRLAGLYLLKWWMVATIAMMVKAGKDDKVLEESVERLSKAFETKQKPFNWKGLVPDVKKVFNMEKVANFFTLAPIKDGLNDIKDNVPDVIQDIKSIRGPSRRKVAGIAAAIASLGFHQWRNFQDKSISTKGKLNKKVAKKQRKNPQGGKAKSLALAATNQQQDPAALFKPGKKTKKQKNKNVPTIIITRHEDLDDNVKHTVEDMVKAGKHDNKSGQMQKAVVILSKEKTLPTVDEKALQKICSKTDGESRLACATGKLINALLEFQKENKQQQDNEDDGPITIQEAFLNPPSGGSKKGKK